MAVVARTTESFVVDGLARDARLHPELVARLLRLGFLDPYPPDAAAQLARAMRLRRDLGLNYSGALLACELLARIDELQERLRRYER
jgi:MerR HTH family regulatory protein/RecC C-terminal domain